MPFRKVDNDIYHINVAIVWVLVDVYERLIQNGKKPGFFQLLATQTVSAVWHVSEILAAFYMDCFYCAVRGYLHYYFLKLTIFANVCIVF